MTCIGLGVDIVEVEKFSRIAEKWGQRLLDRLFTPAERHYCDRKQPRFESYTVRFAANEATLKVLPAGYPDPFFSRSPTAFSKSR